MDYEQLREAQQHMEDAVRILEENHLDFLAEELDELTARVADEIDKEQYLAEEEIAA